MFACMRTRVMGNAEIGQKGAEKMTAEDVKKSLIRQLEDRGANVEHFLALIDDYVFYYKQEKKAQAEVRKNGMTIKATSASGKEYDKENPAIKAAALFNKQKLTILRENGALIHHGFRPSAFHGTNTAAFCKVPALSVPWVTSTSVPVKQARKLYFLCTAFTVS